MAALSALCLTRVWLAFIYGLSTANKGYWTTETDS